MPGRRSAAAEHGTIKREPLPTGARQESPSFDPQIYDDMNDTPASERLHIGFFGRCNSGKSSLINALTGQSVAVVSDIAGTTTDPVSKAMELPGLGACLLTDTPGFDDTGALGPQRIERTLRAADRTQIAVLLFGEGDCAAELDWLGQFRAREIPVIAVLAQCDRLTDPARAARAVEERTALPPLCVSAATGQGIEELRRALAAVQRDEPREITAGVAEQGDTVLLVMPQDAQAPKGRLILPQVQTIRELLDKECTTICCTPQGMSTALAALARPPKLIVTDSQAFEAVYRQKPAASRLTSFSVLFARYKGDIDAFTDGAAAIGRLTPSSRVLIAEACTHAPRTEDIGRVKLPAMLRKKIGAELRVDVVSGADFPDDLTPYDLVIHCGACMFNRRHVLNRIARARAQSVPITNYGVAIAALIGILDRIEY